MRYWLAGTVVLGVVVSMVFLGNSEPTAPPQAEEVAVVKGAEPSEGPDRFPTIKAAGLPATAVPAAGQVAAAPDTAPTLMAEKGTETEKREEVELVQLLLKGPDGKLLKADHESAMSLCTSKGMRLPTIRELAILAKARGAKGILHSSAGPTQDRADKGIARIVAVHPDGQADDFLYDPEGFQPDPKRENIPEDLGKDNFWLQGKWFWSSSRSPNCPLEEPAKYCAWVFDAETAVISDKYDTVPLSALCVK